MHKARAFLFICAGLFLLVLTFGARNAGAQSASNAVVGVAGDGNCLYVGTSNGDIYVYNCGGPAAFRLIGNVFGSPAPLNGVVGVAGDGNCLYVGTSNGDIYVYNCGGPAAFRLIGNVFGAPISAQSSSFGQVKAKYATPASGK